MTIQTSLDTDIYLFSHLQIICSICIDRQMYCPSMSRRNIVKQGCMAMEKLSLSPKNNVNLITSVDHVNEIQVRLLMLD